MDERTAVLGDEVRARLASRRPDVPWRGVAEDCQKKWPDLQGDELACHVEALLVAAWWQKRSPETFWQELQQRCQRPESYYLLRKVVQQLPEVLTKLAKFEPAVLRAAALYPACQSRQPGQAAAMFQLTALLFHRLERRHMRVVTLGGSLAAALHGWAEGLPCCQAVSSAQEAQLLDLQATLLEGESLQLVPADLSVLPEDNKQNVFYLPATGLSSGQTAASWQQLQTCLSAEANGRAFLAWLPTADLSAPEGAAMRQTMAEAGDIEAVITLPGASKAVGETTAPAEYGLVLGSHGNEHIRMVAAELQPQLQAAGLTAATAHSIERMFYEGLDCASRVRAAELQSGADLRPSLYAEPAVSAAPTASWQLSELAACHRGVSLNLLQGARGQAGRQALAELVSETPTAFAQFTVASFQQGSLTYYQEFPAGAERYLLQTGDIVMTRMAPYRCQLIQDLPDGQQLVGDGNVYYLHITSPEVEPVYLYLYLQSAAGQVQLERASSGSSLPNVSLRALGQLRIPQLPLAAQRALVSRYQELYACQQQARAEVARCQQEIDQLLPQAFSEAASV